MGALILSKNYISPPMCKGNIICTDPYLPCLQGRWQNEVLTEGLLTLQVANLHLPSLPCVKLRVVNLHHPSLPCVRGGAEERGGGVVKQRYCKK